MKFNLPLRQEKLVFLLIFLGKIYFMLTICIATLYMLFYMPYYLIVLTLVHFTGSRDENKKQEPMLPLAKEVMSPPATPREINKHHKIVKNGVGHLLADIFKAEQSKVMLLFLSKHDSQIIQKTTLLKLMLLPVLRL